MAKRPRPGRGVLGPSLKTRRLSAPVAKPKPRPTVQDDVAKAPVQDPRCNPTSDPMSSSEGLSDKEEVSALCKSIRCWARTGEWPKYLAAMNKQRNLLPKEEPPTELSYARLLKEGQVPPACSPAYEKYLAEHGIYMDEMCSEIMVCDESRLMCQSLSAEVYPDPAYMPFPPSKLRKVLNCRRGRNEARLCRDITPLLVPSPELLWFSGHDALAHVVEEINAEWAKGSTLAGPMPKPCLAIGIKPSAFDRQETAKLGNYTTSDRMTKFTENMYFPFLLCEIKPTEQWIDRAERQNMHSASMAVNSLVRFISSVDSTAKLSGQVLAISISHNDRVVCFYGHYAVVEGDQITFHRYCIERFFLSDWKKSHDFVRAIYQTFYPLHMARIRATLAKMKDPSRVRRHVGW